MDCSLRPVTFQELPGWTEEDPSGLFASMGRCLGHIEGVKPYKTGTLGIPAQALADVFRLSLSERPDSPEQARTFFEANFQPFRLARVDGQPGFVTAFYEPEVDASDRPDDTWRYPFYRRPDDLIDLDDENRPADLDPSYAFGRLRDGTVAAYPDRQAIDLGYLDGKDLEIAWARSRVDVFFAHVQGAARLRFRDGSLRRITYSAKAGHPFTGIGRHLAGIGEIPLSEVSMASIRQWLADHPERQDEILWQNRSYIFFREAPVEGLDLGPIAAAKVPLEAMHSIAVDKQIHTFSSLLYLDSQSLTHLMDGKPFQRLMIALDTGTAIVGPTRADIFTGAGPAAGDLAGNVRNDADFYILIPNAIAEKYR